MTNLQKMQAAQEKMQEIQKSTTAIAAEFKTAFSTKQNELQYDVSLSPQGRLQKLEAFKAEQGAKFIAKAAEIRSAYDKAAMEAQVAAELYLNEPANKPNEVAVQTFERRLSEFETALLLATNPDKAMELVREFAADTQDPYFAAKLKEKMPTIIREVTALAKEKAPLYKVHLSSVLDGINHTATAGGHTAAQQVLDAGSRVGADIWRKGGVQINAIQQFVGGEYARHANNPSNYVAE